MALNRISLCYQFGYKCYLLEFCCFPTQQLAFGIQDHFAHLLLSVVSHLITMEKCVVLSSLSLSAAVTDVEPG